MTEYQRGGSLRWGVCAALLARIINPGIGHQSFGAAHFRYGSAYPRPLPRRVLLLAICIHTDYYALPSIRIILGEKNSPTFSGLLRESFRSVINESGQRCVSKTVYTLRCVFSRDEDAFIHRNVILDAR